jgi:type I restriction enzyme S subunit
MNSETPLVSLRDAGVKLIDCVHKTPAAADHGFPYIAIPQLSEGRVDVDSARRISEQDMLEWNVKCNPQEDDIILSRRCNPGVTAVIPKGFRGSLGQNLVLLRATDTNLLTPKYLRWVTRGREWWNEVDRFINVGAVFESLKCADIPEFAIPVPSIPEQRAIAHILGTLDDKIELNRKTNETLEAMAKALFKSWFVDFDPVRAKAEDRPTGLPAEISDLFPDSFEDSELGEIPSGWKVAEIDQIINLKKDSIDPSCAPDEAFDHYSIPAFDSGRYPAKELGSSIKSQKFLVSGEDLLVSKLNPSTSRVWIPFSASSRRAISSTEFLVCRALNDVGRAFAYCLACSDSIVEAMTGLAGGTSNSHQRIRPGDFLALACCTGSEKARSAFAEVAEPLLTKSLALRTESKSLSSTRDTLLPKLISGEIRIPDVEKMLEEVGI